MKKVEEASRRSEKAREGWRKLEKVGELYGESLKRIFRPNVEFETPSGMLRPATFGAGVL